MVKCWVSFKNGKPIFSAWDRRSLEMSHHLMNELDVIEIKEMKIEEMLKMFEDVSEKKTGN